MATKLKNQIMTWGLDKDQDSLVKVPAHQFEYLYSYKKVPDKAERIQPQRRAEL